MNSSENNKNNLVKEKINFQANKPNSGNAFGRRFRHSASGVIGQKGRREQQDAASLSQEFNISKTKTLIKLKESLEKYEALISYSTQTRYWLTGFNATEGVSVIFLNKKKELEIHAFLDSRYFEAAKAAITTKGVKLYNQKPEFVNFVKSCKFKTLLLESDYTNLVQAVEVRNWVGRECLLFNLGAEELRVVKTTEEIERIKKAVEISLDAYKWVRTSVLFPGVTEEEVARAFSQKMYQLGADAPAFPPIVAFGENTANPHHSAGNTKLKPGDIVTLDFGARYKNYCSDITRTFLAPGISNLDKAKKDELRRVWEIVNRSAYIGRETAAAGVAAAGVDKVCRNVIEEQGLGKYFSHGTGHGVGLDIHESPRLSPTSSETLEVGHVFTVEPGVYIPRLGGARIEDTLVINNAGIAKILSRPYLYTSLGNYQREFDFFDINQLLRELKIGKTTLPVRSQNNRDFFNLLRVYEEALKLPSGEDGWQHKNFRERFTDQMVSAKKSPFHFRSEEKEGEFGPRHFRSGKPQTFDAVKVQPLSEVLEQVYVGQPQPVQPAEKPRRGRKPKQVVEPQTQESRPVAEVFAPRRRGRPRKVEKQNPVVQEAVSDNKVEPKRRGRPKKVVTEPVKSENLVAKKRGRKPKQVVEAQAQESRPVAEVFAPRRRGRPRKVEKQNPVVQEAVSDNKVEPKRRGRPKKVVTEPVKSENLVAKKRGRKPKQVVEARVEENSSPLVLNLEKEEKVQVFEETTGQKRGQKQSQNTQEKQLLEPQPSPQRGRKTEKPSLSISSSEPAALPKKRGRRPKAIKESGSSSSRRRGR